MATRRTLTVGTQLRSFGVDEIEFGRQASRGHPGKALVPSALIGALLLTAADLVVRAVPLDRPIPVGVITALFGTPLFLWLVVTMRRRVTA